jgi:hypothetical protein
MRALNYLQIIFMIGILVASYFLYQEAIRTSEIIKQQQQINSLYNIK